MDIRYTYYIFNENFNYCCMKMEQGDIVKRYKDVIGGYALGNDHIKSLIERKIITKLTKNQVVNRLLNKIR